MTKDEEALFGINKLNVPRSHIPAVTHVDYSARVQTVHQETNVSWRARAGHVRSPTLGPAQLRNRLHQGQVPDVLQS
jgi:carbamoyltransferase